MAVEAGDRVPGCCCTPAKKRPGLGRRILNIAAILALIVIAARILQLSFADAIVIEPVSVPKSLAEAGYTPDGTAVELGSAMRKIYEDSRSRKAFTSLSFPRADVLESIEVPKTKFTLRALIDLLRYLLAIRPVRVQSTITQTGNTFQLLLHIESGSLDTAEVFAADDVQTLLAQGAHFTLRNLDPYLEAAALFTSEREDEAVELARRSIHSASCDARCKSMMYNLWGNVLANRARYADALAKYREAVRLDEKNTYARLGWGIVLDEQHDLKGALEQFRLALAVDPRQSLAYNNMASSFLQQGDIDAAEKSLTRAAALDPAQSLYERNLGAVAYARHRTDEAAEHFRNAIALSPNEPDAYLEWSRQLEAAGDLPAAQGLALRARAAAPDAASVYVRLFELAVAMGKFDAATAQLPDLSRTAGRNINALLALSRLHDLRNSAGAARAALQQAISICPDCPNVWREQAAYFSRNKKPAEAISAIERAAALDPNNVSSYLQWGIILRDSGHLPEAIAKFEQAVTVAPRSAVAYMLLGKALLAAGRLDEAEQRFRQALQFEAHSAGAQKGLADVAAARSSATKRPPPALPAPPPSPGSSRGAPAP